MIIRQAQLGDLEKIVQLIAPFMNDFIVEDDKQPMNEGQRHFSRSVIQAYLEDAGIHYFVAEKQIQQQHCIVGIMAYRAPRHILHFFVDATWQGQGVGTQLWQFVQTHMGLEKGQCVTVNSSCFAEKIYKKMGFSTVSDVQEAQGLRFIQMQKQIK